VQAPPIRSRSVLLSSSLLFELQAQLLGPCLIQLPRTAKAKVH
jgi:hypothetical protein